MQSQVRLWKTNAHQCPTTTSNRPVRPCLTSSGKQVVVLLRTNDRASAPTSAPLSTGRVRRRRHPRRQPSHEKAWEQPRSPAHGSNRSPRRRKRTSHASVRRRCWKYPSAPQTCATARKVGNLVQTIVMSTQVTWDSVIRDTHRNVKRNNHYIIFFTSIYMYNVNHARQNRTNAKKETSQGYSARTCFWADTAFYQMLTIS